VERGAVRTRIFDWLLIFRHGKRERRRAFNSPSAKKDDEIKRGEFCDRGKKKRLGGKDECPIHALNSALLILYLSRADIEFASESGPTK